ncbi:GNAT family N-acetyltransferase, partial [Acidocella sp.]|uniref:GNAT family N-acetyltransferase n=1 Tax=Acidocella sp. TaxID=50710 RepID=UPI00345827AF
MNDRFLANQATGFVWVVAEGKGQLLGCGYFAPLRDRPAYDKTVEDSVYVENGVRGQGGGRGACERVTGAGESGRVFSGVVSHW